MRRQAIRILENFPPPVSAEPLRKLLNDKDRGNQNWAALYLVRRVNDPDARAVLIKNASDNDPTIAAPAVGVLGNLQGDDVHGLLERLLSDEETPEPVRLAAIVSAGTARVRRCTAPLIDLLDNKERRSPATRDSVRVCDMAASALERIYRINYTGTRNVYFDGSIEARDGGIAVWKEWYASRPKHAALRTRAAYLAKLLDDSVTELARQPDQSARSAIKGRLLAALGTTFCLGDLVGVDAVVGPCVRDLARIIQVYSEDHWHGLVKSWRSLQRVYSGKFLPDGHRASSAHEKQALEFICFSGGIASFNRVSLWALCQNFGESFPDSDLLGNVNTIKERLDADFALKKRQVVRHGHIPVLEPVRKAQQTGNMIPVASGSLTERVTQEPSEWAHHREAVDYCERNNVVTDRYWYFDQLVRLYVGNEWPFLADAAYQLRVLRRSEHALTSADKALILNPGNPKAYALRGMIRVVAGRGGELALEDLKKAFELDPQSLGDEPETPQAVFFLVEQTLKAGDKAAARKYLEALGGLKAFRAEQPLKEVDRFKELMRQAQD